MVLHTMSRTVVLGVIGSDAHVVGITILEQAFSAAGFDVVNLGVQTSQAEFAEAAVAHDAEAVLVSSLYGHAEQDCQGFHEVLDEADVDAVTYIGGNLDVGQSDFEQTRRTFQKLGFDRVFDSETDPEDAIAALRQDLEITPTESERATISS
ncbi:methylaspartate mutase subunit S [Natronobacterium gregoryi]|uniref:Glutamate mutase sigma subunit n=2 Tax=Natronobacterium gregoryi TaxID=44930 RepID=L0AKS9_NATGS|nr:methylaspartate mutase subunit S [Natronobacterium gregoryi]AFZ74508.1 methylaspartate mutase, S subunit [Natronobacterium gregoryi SP2]ELY72418.1 methylaspartate mutase subunit S [Natronobacterium gregoryi SP2]PLK21746.1 methylaspartate mutase subunit S [Natronobacterium gregoryi SP2]SFI97989.1 glutamate mutase subunit S [Natronobacterium gregoryi]